MPVSVDKQVGKGDIYNVIVGVQSRDGRVALSGSAGTADAATGAAMTVDTPYALASITKMYMAAVIMKLHEQGRIDLDAAISDYLPTSMLEDIHVYRGKDYSRQIKVYQLVNQTSGLADYEMGKVKGGLSVFDQLKQGSDLALDIEDTLAIVRTLSPAFEPGARGETQTRYANTNYRLLGAIAEAVTARSVLENYEALIFAPLGLRQTRVYPTGPTAAPEKPADIYLKDKVVVAPRYLASNTADGCLVSTAAENLTFLRAFFEGKLFSAALFDRMTRRWNGIFFPMQYGYGMMRIHLPRIFSPLRPFPELIGHSGSTGAFAYYCPEKALYLAGTTNQIANPSKPIRLVMQLAAAVK